MKVLRFGKYDYNEFNYSANIKEHLPTYCLPLFYNTTNEGTVVTLSCERSPFGNRSSFLIFNENQTDNSLVINMFSGIPVLIAFINYRFHSHSERILIHEIHMTDALEKILRESCFVSKMDSYYQLTAAKSYNLKGLELYLDSFVYKNDIITMTLVIDDKCKEVYATREAIDAFNDLLVKKQLSGYVLLNPNLLNYGDIITYISRFKHSCIEVDPQTNEIKVWVLLCPILLLGQKFPQSNGMRKVRA